MSLAHAAILPGVAFLLLCGGCSRTPSESGSGTAAGTGITQRLEKLTGGPLWNIESVGPVGEAWKNQSFDLPAHEQLTIVGWAVDQKAKSAAGGVEVAIDGVPYTADYGKSRPDVAAAQKNPQYENSGFSVALAAGKLSPGTHTALIRVLTHDRTGFWEVGPYTLNLR